MQGFNAQIPGIVKTRADAGKHVHLVDIGSKVTASDLADGIHPNATGYAKMAAAWYEALVDYPRPRPRRGHARDLAVSHPGRHARDLAVSHPGRHAVCHSAVPRHLVSCAVTG